MRSLGRLPWAVGWEPSKEPRWEELRLKQHLSSLGSRFTGQCRPGGLDPGRLSTLDLLSEASLRVQPSGVRSPTEEEGEEARAPRKGPVSPRPQERDALLWPVLRGALASPWLSPRRSGGSGKGESRRRGDSGTCQQDAKVSSFFTFSC